MAGGGAADAAAGIAKANVAVKGFGKGIQAATLYANLWNKAFGPFYDLFVKSKQIMQLTSEVMEDVTDNFGEMGEAVGGVAKVVGGLLKGLKGVVMIMTMGIGIVLMLMLGLSMMGGSMGGLGDILPGIGDSLGAIWDGFMKIGENIMGIISIIFNLDFSPIIEPLIGFGVALIQGMVGFIGLWMKVLGAVTGGILKIFQHLSETGALQALIDAIGGLMGSIMWAFGFIFESLEAAGVTFESVGDFLSDVITGFVSFLLSSGIIDFIVETAILISKIGSIVIVVGGIVIGIIIRIIGWLVPIFKPIFLLWWKALKLAITIVMSVVRTIMGIVSILVGVLTLDWEMIAAGGGVIYDAFVKAFDSLWEFLTGWFDSIMWIIQPILDAIEWAADTVEAAGSFVGDAWDEATSWIGFASGGIARGPASGHMAMLHGTEAVVPLPDGSTIPVTIKGMGGRGGSSFTANINVSGGGNAREIAQKVSEEVQRAFRTRSRSSGFGRGVI